MLCGQISCLHSFQRPRLRLHVVVGDRLLDAKVHRLLCLLGQYFYMENREWVCHLAAVQIRRLPVGAIQVGGLQSQGEQILDADLTFLVLAHPLDVVADGELRQLLKMDCCQDAVDGERL